jgi:hypothetical protein
MLEGLRTLEQANEIGISTSKTASTAIYEILTK